MQCRHNWHVQVDSYSYGVLLWEIVTKEQPVRGHLREITAPDECALCPDHQALIIIELL